MVGVWVKVRVNWQTSHLSLRFRICIGWWWLRVGGSAQPLLCISHQCLAQSDTAAHCMHTQANTSLHTHTWPVQLATGPHSAQQQNPRSGEGAGQHPHSAAQSKLGRHPHGATHSKLGRPPHSTMGSKLGRQRPTLKLGSTSSRSHTNAHECTRLLVRSSSTRLAAAVARALGLPCVRGYLC